MKFWIVGKDGLFGREMCALLEANEVVFFGTSHKEGDILDKEKIDLICQNERPTHIVNCAAYVNVDEAENKGKKKAFEINVVGPKNLVEVASSYQIRLIHIGTDYVFDGNSAKDYKESDPVHPINEYGRTKLEGEKEVLSYEKGCSIRTASLYGLGKPGIVSNILDQLKTKKEVSHVLDQISSPTYTKDLAEAIFQIKNESGLFHFTNKGSVSRYGLVCYIKEIAIEMGISLECENISGVTQKQSKRAATRPIRSVLSTTKITKYLERPIRSWEAALREYMKKLC